ncbi:MAG: S9 family peptidase [Telluria sp.]
MHSGILIACRLGLLSLLLAAALVAHAAPPAIEDFFDNPALSAAVLSPDARSLAVRVGSETVRERLAVVDLATNAIKVIAQFSDLDIRNFEWINDERLVFDSFDKSAAQGDVRYGPGLYAVNRDGSGFRQLANINSSLFQSERGARLLPWNTFMLGLKGAQDSEFIYVASPNYQGLAEIDHVKLLRLNTLNGRTDAVNRPGSTRSWLLDHKGEPRLATTLDDNTVAVHYRDPATGQWRKLTQFEAYVSDPRRFEPLAFAPDGTLYVSTRAGRDTSAVHTFDFATNEVNKTALLELAGYDFRGELVTTRDKLYGINYLTDARSTVWFDEKMKAMQKTIDQLLPSTVNLISVAARAQTPWVLVRSYSDIRPSTYLLFNTETSTLNKIGDTYAKIKPSEMGRQDMVRYKARDGLEIPGLLTLPNGSSGKNLPLVVLVHGGPFVRGSEWGWHPDTQFLASRGYAILEPEYRGSTGFGAKHFRAGWKQWGLAMQDDIADGAKWAIAQGIADPKRICIAGASYGGYATLMGLVNDPALFKCGIDWAGVTDIKLMYTGHWSFTSDLPDGWKQYGMPVLIGDPVKDADQLKATSPLEQAARITQPLLLAYGGADRRVPLYHGEKFYAAVKKTNPNVEWVVYNEEGHGWALPKNRIDFWSRVEKFLARHIGTP